MTMLCDAYQLEQTFLEWSYPNRLDQTQIDRTGLTNALGMKGSCYDLCYVYLDDSGRDQWGTQPARQEATFSGPSIIHEEL